MSSMCVNVTDCTEINLHFTEKHLQYGATASNQTSERLLTPIQLCIISSLHVATRSLMMSVNLFRFFKFFSKRDICDYKIRRHYHFSIAQCLLQLWGWKFHNCMRGFQQEPPDETRISLISMLHFFFFHPKHVGGLECTCWSARFVIRRFHSHCCTDPESPMQYLFIKWEFKANLHLRAVSARCTHAQWSYSNWKRQGAGAIRHSGL